MNRGNLRSTVVIVTGALCLLVYAVRGIWIQEFWRGWIWPLCVVIPVLLLLALAKQWFPALCSILKLVGDLLRIDLPDTIWIVCVRQLPAMVLISILIVLPLIAVLWPPPFLKFVMSNYLTVPIATGALVALYAVIGMIAFRYRYFCEIVSEDKSYQPLTLFQSLPSGPVWHTVYLYVSVLVGMALYQHADILLHNRILASADGASRNLVANARIRVLDRLQECCQLLAELQPVPDGAKAAPEKKAIEFLNTLLAREQLRLDQKSTNHLEFVYQKSLVSFVLKADLKPKEAKGQASADAKANDTTAADQQDPMEVQAAVAQTDADAKLKKSLVQDVRLVEAFQNKKETIFEILEDLFAFFDISTDSNVGYVTLHPRIADFYDALQEVGGGSIKTSPMQTKLTSVLLGEDAWKVPQWKPLGGGVDNWQGFWSAVFTEYRFPESFQVTERIVKDEKLRANKGPAGDQLALFLIASTYYKPLETGETASPALWSRSAKSLAERLATGDFQEMIRKDALNQIRAPDGSVQILGLTLPTLRSCIRGPIQLVTIIVFFWGLCYALLNRGMLGTFFWQLGYLPAREEASPYLRSGKNRWDWEGFWKSKASLCPLDAHDPYVTRIHDAAKHTEDLVPRMLSEFFDGAYKEHSTEAAETAARKFGKKWLEERQEDLDFLDFVTFVLPQIGFIGTIVGLCSGLTLAATMGVPSTDPFHKARVIADMSTQLGTAFYTTLVALLGVIPIAFLAYLLRQCHRYVEICAEERITELSRRIDFNNTGAEESRALAQL